MNFQKQIFCNPLTLMKIIKFSTTTASIHNNENWIQKKGKQTEERELFPLEQGQ